MSAYRVGVGGFFALLTILFSLQLRGDEKPRTSADGVEYPAVTFPVDDLPARDKQAKLLDLINSYLNRPPEDLKAKVRSSTKSEKMLEGLMTRHEDYDESQQGHSFGGPSKEVYHRQRTLVDKLPNSWFVEQLSGTGAEVVGFSLTDGVISRVTLYFQRPKDIINTLVDAARLNNCKRCVYRVFKIDRITYFDVLATGPIYLASHPHLPREIKEAMEQYRLTDGMQMEQAVALFGDPDFHYVYDGRAIVTTVEINGGVLSKFELSGKPACSWTLIDGTVWTALLRNGELYNVTKTTRDGVQSESTK